MVSPDKTNLVRRYSTSRHLIGMRSNLLSKLLIRLMKAISQTIQTSSQGHYRLIRTNLGFRIQTLHLLAWHRHSNKLTQQSQLVSNRPKPGMKNTCSLKSLMLPHLSIRRVETSLPKPYSSLVKHSRNNQRHTLL